MTDTDTHVPEAAQWDQPIVPATLPEEMEELPPVGLEPEDEDQKPTKEVEPGALLDWFLKADPSEGDRQTLWLNVERLPFPVMVQNLDGVLIEEIFEKYAEKPGGVRSPRARPKQAGRTIAQQAEVVLYGMIDPNLRDPEVFARLSGRFQTGPSAVRLIQRLFLPGEITKMFSAILDLSGYGDESVLEARAGNS
jgi:Phage XkdN-like tail assembly chaperone protein, TAC